MGRRSVHVGLGCALLLATTAVSAADYDLSGDWKLTMEGDSPSGEGWVGVAFEREGHELVATLSGENGQVQCRGWIDDNRIRFYCVRPSEGGEFVARFTGHVADDPMGGEVDMGDMGKTTWRATRSR